MDDFPATQLCESSKSFSELSQTQTPDGDKKKQIGTLKILNKEYPVYIGRNTIGRHNSNQIIIKDASVSKHHAEIEGRKRSCFVTDLKSLNGTFDQFKEKYLENKAYMLMNASTIKFGQIEAVFRHFRYDGNVIKTPVSARRNQIVASTPQSAVNSTHDDSSVVYGTQAAQAISSPCSSKFVVPKNLHNEFSKIVDDLDENEGEFHKNLSVNISSVNEAVSHKNLKHQNSEEHDLFSHVSSNDIPTTSFKNIEEEPTQAFIVKKCSKSSENPNIVPESDSDSDNDHENDISGRDKIFELETQPVASSINKNTSRSFQNHSKTLATDDEDDIFKQQTQIVEKKLLPKVENKNISIDSSNIHLEVTQSFEKEENGSIDKNVSANQSRVKDSDKEVFKEAVKKIPDKADDIHDNATQVFSTKSNDIHEVKTQAFLSPSTRVPLKSKALAKLEDSDTDEEGIFEGSTQKVEGNLDNIHEAITQASSKSKDNEDSETDEEGLFNEPTQKVSTKSDKIHEQITQVIPSNLLKLDEAKNLTSNIATEVSTESNRELSDHDDNIQKTTNQVFSKPDNIHENETQAFSDVNKISHEEYSAIFESEDIDFEGPTQKFPQKVRNLHEDATQVFEKNKIHEDKTQVFLSPSTRKLPGTSKADRKEDSRNFETEETDFEGPTQKLPERLDNIHEDVTQVFSTKSANIHEDKTQAFSSPAARKLHETSKDLDEQNEDSRNLEDDDDIDFDGPTQKMPERNDNIYEDSTQVFSRKSENIHESKTQVFPSPSTRKFDKKSEDQEKERNEDERSLEADEIDFEGPTQKLPERLDNIHENETQVFSRKSANIHEDKTQIIPSSSGPKLLKSALKTYTRNSMKKHSSAFESNEIDFDGETQKISDNIHQDETELFSISDKREKILDAEEIDYEGPTQKLVTKSVRIDETATQFIEGYQSGKENSDTDEEGIFENSKKDGKKEEIHEANTQLCDKSEKDESDTDEEGVFENSKEDGKKEEIHEANTQLCDKSEKDESDTDEEGVFENSKELAEKSVEVEANTETGRKSEKDDSDTDEEGVFENSKELAEKSVEVEANTEIGRKSEKDESDTDEEGVFENSKELAEKSVEVEANTEIGRKSEKYDSDTDEEGVFEGLTDEKSTKNPETKTLENTTEIENSSTAETRNENASKLDDSKILLAENSKEREIEASSVSEEKENEKERKKEKEKQTATESKKATPTTKRRNKIQQSTIDSPSASTVSKKKKPVPESKTNTTNISENKTKNSDIFAMPVVAEQDTSKNTSNDSDFTGFSPRRSRRSTVIHEKVENFIQKCKKTSPSKSKTKTELKSTDNSESKFSETSENENSKLHETSDAEVEEIFKNKKDSKETKSKRNIQKNSPIPSSSKQLETEMKNDTDTSLGKQKRKPVSQSSTREQKISKTVEKETSPRKSLRLEKSLKNDNEPAEEKVTSPKKSDVEEKKKKTWKFILPLSADDPQQEETTTTSSQENYEMDSRLASVENLEYETSATQAMDDIEKSQEKKIVSKSPKKAKSPTRRSVRLNDTIEEHLNEMFEGASEVIEEPHQMLTQQLENILETSQYEPSTSRGRESTTRSPKVNVVGNHSPRMSQLNIQVERPLKKRALRTSDNEKHDETLLPVKNKRAKQDENSPEGVISNTTRSKIVVNPSPDTSSSSIAEDSPAPTKNLKVPQNPRSRRTKRTNSPKNQIINSSTSMADDSEDTSITKKSRSKRIKPISPKVEVTNSSSSINEDSADISTSNNTKRKRIKPISPKVKVTNSSSSINEDSEDISITKKSRSKRIKPISPKVEVTNSSSSINENSADISTSNNTKRKRIKPISPKVKVTNSSSSIHEDSDLQDSQERRKNAKQPAKRTNSKRTTAESSTNDSTNASKEAVVNPRISRRGKIPTSLPSTSFINSKVDESMKTDPNSSVASSSKTNSESISLNSSKTKELVKVNPRRGRVRKTVNAEEITNASSSNSISEKTLNETASSISLQKTIITEPKKTRGRKTKTPNQSLNQENLTASSSILSQADSDLNSSSASTSSRAKRSRQSSPLKHKVLFTGIPVNNYQKQLTKLGLNETDDVNKCTILVTDKVRRTFKFLCAVSRGIPILSVKWITDSAKKSNIQDLEDYVINDPTAESKFNFNLKDSLQKARDRKMLEGYTVILTPNINAPPVAELKEMVTASGGKVALRAPAKWQKDTIIVSNDQDRENAIKFMAKAPNTVSLHSTEFLLTGILKQEVDLESYLLKLT